MGDRPNYRYGRQPAGSSGLEFVGSRKQSRFAQYTQQFSGATSQPAPQQATQMPPAQPVQNQYDVQSLQPYASQQEQLQESYDVHGYDQYDVQPSSYSVQDTQQAVVTAYANDEPDLVTDTTFENLFQEEPAGQPLRQFPSESHIKRPMLQQDKKRVSPLKAAFATLGVIVALGIIGVSVMYIQQTRPAVSSGLKAKAGFPVYDIVANASFKVDRKSVELSENNSLVYIVYQNDNNARFVVSQQAVPDVIKEDAQFQQFLLETDKFASMESKMGKAYFTRPANIGTDISVIIKTDTTLLFIRGPGTTSEQDWSNLLAYLNK
jgi:hypothetical protein